MSCFLFAGVPTENIWQAVLEIVPLNYGMQTAENVFELWKNIQSPCVPFAGGPMGNIWQSACWTEKLKYGTWSKDRDSVSAIGF